MSCHFEPVITRTAIYTPHDFSWSRIVLQLSYCGVSSAEDQPFEIVTEIARCRPQRPLKMLSAHSCFGIANWHSRVIYKSEDFRYYEDVAESWAHLHKAMPQQTTSRRNGQTTMRGLLSAMSDHSQIFGTKDAHERKSKKRQASFGEMEPLICKQYRVSSLDSWSEGRRQSG